MISPNASVIPPPQIQDRRVGYVNFFPNPLDQRTRAIPYTLTDRQLAHLPPHPSEETFHSFAARGLAQMGRQEDVPQDHGAHLIRFSANEAYQPLPLYQVFDPKFWHANFNEGGFLKVKSSSSAPPRRSCTISSIRRSSRTGPGPSCTSKRWPRRWPINSCA